MATDPKDYAPPGAVSIEWARPLQDDELESPEFRAALLESQTEASPDGILVVSLEGRILSFNRRFVELWMIPGDVVAVRSDDAAIAAVLNNVVDPVGFEERIRYLYAHPDETSLDEIELRDGRVLHRHSAPIRGPEGTLYGRVWFFRDVTEQTRAERAAAELQRRLAFLAEASHHIASTLDYRETLLRLVDLSVPFLGDWCFIDVIEKGGAVRRVALAHGPEEDPGLVEQLRMPQPDPGAAHGVYTAIFDGRPVLVEKVTPGILKELAGGSIARFESLQGMAPESYMIVPLKSRSNLLGALIVVSSRSKRTYGPADLVLVEELARRAAVAIDNSLLYQESHNIARTLQRSLLPPSLPEIPGVEMAARYESSSEGAEVGGDFYDVFPCGRSRWALVIGDVCGKGAEAAALTGLARHTLRAAAVQQRRPHTILSVLNTALVEQTEDERFCTAVFGILERSAERARLTVCCAGHPPPLLARSDGRLEQLGEVGALLGVLDSPQLKDYTIELDPGDTVMLFTDGVVEANESFAEPELFALLRSVHGAPAEQVVEAVMDSVSGRRAGPLRDDVAVLVVRVTDDFSR